MTISEQIELILRKIDIFFFFVFKTIYLIFYLILKIPVGLLISLILRNFEFAKYTFYNWEYIDSSRGYKIYKNIFEWWLTN